MNTILIVRHKDLVFVVIIDEQGGYTIYLVGDEHDLQSL